MVNFEDPAEKDRRDKMIFLEWAKKTLAIRVFARL
jgi:hypothetical protein